MSVDPALSRRVYETLFEHTANAVLVVDTDRRVKMINPAFTKLFGYSAGEVVGTSSEMLYKDTDQFRDIAVQLEALGGQPPNEFYYTLYRSKTGREIIGETKAALLNDDNGALIGYIATIRDITETVQRTGEVADTEQLFRDALESVRDTAWRMDLLTNEIELAGPAAEDIFGIEGMKGRLTLDDWKQRLTDHGVTACTRFVEDLFENGQAQTELSFARPDGSLIFARDTGRVIKRNSDGHPLVAAGTFSDITERKQLEEKSTEAEQYLESAMGTADLGAWRFDLADNTCQLTGPLARHVNLKTPNEVFTGAYWCSLVHRDDVGDVIRQTLAITEGRSDTIDVSYRLKDKAGQWRWLRSIGGVTRKDAIGRGLIANGIIKDETDTIELQARLETERNRFESIFRRTPAMFHQIDSDGIIINVSAYWLSHMGYTREEVIGRPSSDFLTEESRIYANQHAIPDLMMTGRARNVALRFRRKNGDTIDGLMNAYLETHPGTGEKTGYGVMTDVTQLRKAYRDLERSNRELDRFATIASHDLQEPLRKISAFAGLLRGQYGGQLDADGDRCLEFLVDGATRMQQLIDDLLEYSQLEMRPVRPEELTLSGLIADIETQLSTRIATANASVSLSGNNHLVADRFLLTQILQNLVSNSIKYRSKAAPIIQIEMSECNAGWTISVADNGIGFEPKFAEQVFEPFRRLHPRGEYEGAGIGLAIVRQAVDRQNGRISVDTRPHEGSKFTVFLPQNSVHQRTA